MRKSSWISLWFTLLPVGRFFRKAWLLIHTLPVSALTPAKVVKDFVLKVSWIDSLLFSYLVFTHPPTTTLSESLWTSLGTRIERPAHWLLCETLCHGSVSCEAATSVLIAANPLSLGVSVCGTRDTGRNIIQSLAVGVTQRAAEGSVKCYVK